MVHAMVRWSLADDVRQGGSGRPAGLAGLRVLGDLQPPTVLIQVVLSIPWRRLVSSGVSWPPPLLGPMILSWMPPPSPSRRCQLRWFPSQPGSLGLLTILLNDTVGGQPSSSNVKWHSMLGFTAGAWSVSMATYVLGPFDSIATHRMTSQHKRA